MATHTFIRSICLLLLFAILAGCGPRVAAPISSRSDPPVNKIDYHIVSKGETVFAIAWRYELDYKQLAAANNLNASYTIYEGQKLSLDLSAAKLLKTTAGNKSLRPSALRSSKSTAVEKPVAKVLPSAPKPVAAAPKSIVSKVATQLAALPKTWRWRWPAKGRVSRHYDSNRVFKGLHIQAGKGRAVTAAAPGVVVYAGSGVRGYGRLIIVKHSSVYLSAYAQNRRVLVAEGDRVVAGQQIGEVGGDGENPGRLYFEIRRDGKSVDPMRLLPKR